MKFITKEYLRKNPDHIFVFGDNYIHKGKGGAAILRDEPNTYGFITKKKPSHLSSDYFTVDEYHPVYRSEIKKLKEEIKNHPKKLFLISKVGAGIANKYGIWENIIESNIKNDLKEFENIEFLW